MLTPQDRNVPTLVAPKSDVTPLKFDIKVSIV